MSGKISKERKSAREFQKIMGCRLKQKAKVPTQEIKCPKHGTPYKMESSKDPINEGSWRHFFCEKCRQELRG